MSDSPTDELDGVFVVARRRSYCEHDASVFPLHRRSPDRVGLHGAVFHGTVDACEAYASEDGCRSVGTVDEPVRAMTHGAAISIMDAYEARLHRLVTKKA